MLTLVLITWYFFTIEAAPIADLESSYTEFSKSDNEPVCASTKSFCIYYFEGYDSSNEFKPKKLSESLETKMSSRDSIVRKFSQNSVGVFGIPFTSTYYNYTIMSNLISLLREERLTYGIIRVKSERLNEESTVKFFINIEHKTELFLFIEILDQSSANPRFYTLCPWFYSSKGFSFNYLYPIGRELNVKHDILISEKCHSSFRGHYILYPDRDALQTRSDCTNLGENFQGEERICAIDFIVTRLNATLIYELPKGRLREPEAFVIRNTVLEYIPSGQYEWISRTIEPYSFLVVLNKVANTLKIPSPLGRQIESWRFAILMTMPSVFVLNIILTNYKEKKGKFSLKNIFYSFLSTNIYLSQALYDQCSPNLVKRLNAERKLVLRILLALWLLLSSIVLCGAFKGALSSYLTKETPITTPANFVELSKSELPLFTIDSHQNSDGQFTSIFRDIIDFLVVNMRVSEVEQSTYLSIRNKVILLAQSTLGALVSAFQKNLIITENIEEKFRNQDGPANRLPESFVLIGFESGILHCMALMKPFTNIYVVKPMFADYTISLKIGLVAPKNHFGRQFSRIYSILIESGIYNIWSKYRRILFLKLDKIFINCVFQASNPQEAFYDESCRGYDSLYNQKNTPSIYVHTSKGKALSLKSFHTALKNYYIGVGYTSGTLVLENLFYVYTSKVSQFKWKSNGYLP